MNRVMQFTSKRGKAVVTVYEDEENYPYVAVTVPRYCWLDYPIRYKDGSIAYDFPSRIPKYARSMVVKAYQWVDQNYPVEYIMSPTSNLPNQNHWFITCNKDDMQPYLCTSVIAEDFWGAVAIISRHAAERHYTSITIRWIH